jgi:hypothetical protein
MFVTNSQQVIVLVALKVVVNGNADDVRSIGLAVLAV